MSSLNSTNRTAAAKLFGYGSVVNQNGRIFSLRSHFFDKTIGLFFSANSCEKSKKFLPILIDFYNEYSEDKRFEIVFISADDDEESFNKSYKEMPWLGNLFNLILKLFFFICKNFLKL
jgi:thiol-disulfide isomerase/thioredoxin